MICRDDARWGSDSCAALTAAVAVATLRAAAGPAFASAAATGWYSLIKLSYKRCRSTRVVSQGCGSVPGARTGRSRNLAMASSRGRCSSWGRMRYLRSAKTCQGERRRWAKGGWPCSLPSSSRLRQPPLACVRYMRGMLRRKGWGSPMLRGGTRQAAVGAGLPAAYRSVSIASVRARLASGPIVCSSSSSLSEGSSGCAEAAAGTTRVDALRGLMDGVVLPFMRTT
mmetsp:Transcript_18294/g.51295  ORF Transcript_18294/g.51295 Transcript_18294/m.51295 type:complete len:226 (-) Transcript_18294:350-1027(-)